jgi:hypothetical protein
MRASHFVFAVGVQIVLLACRPPQPAPTPSPPLPTTPVNPSTRTVAQEILDASIVSDSSLQGDVSLDTGALPARTVMNAN